VVENGVRKTYSARYYNPATGRFLSRDPLFGNIFDPRTLHKYLYAGGDPSNVMDPTGRGLVENTLIRAWIFTQISVPMYIQGVGVLQFWGAVGALAGTGVTIVCELMEVAEIISTAKDAKDDGTTVGAPRGGGCGGDHPAPGGPGHPDEPPNVPPGSDPYPG
jgi:RHS repeat-associated protein